MVLTNPGFFAILYPEIGENRSLTSRPENFILIFPRLSTIIYTQTWKVTHRKEKIMTVKVVNYTEAMVARLHEGYDGSASDEARREMVAALAAELGKSEASVRAKLTSEGIYVPYTKAPAGKNTVRKAALVAAIAIHLGVDEEKVESLEKANKSALALIYKALAA